MMNNHSGLSTGSAPSAIYQAKELYHTHGLNLAKDIGAYLEHGVVIKFEDRMMLARPINLGRPREWLAATGDEADAWYVHLAIGTGLVRWFIAQMPYFLPSIAWRREFTGSPHLHIYDTKQLKRRIG